MTKYFRNWKALKKHFKHFYKKNLKRVLKFKKNLFKGVRKNYKRIIGRKQSRKTIQNNRPKNIRWSVAGGLALVLIGVLVASVSLFNTWRAQHSAAAPVVVSQALKNNRPPHTNAPKISGTPVHIEIPSLGIDLQVIPGYYFSDTNTWTLTNTSAQYAVMTAKANNKSGDTYIYAHSLKWLFLNLPKIKPGDEAIVKTDNGHTFSYKFRESMITAPTDTSLFTYKGKSVLVLQNCTGLWWQNRQLFMFDFEKVK